MSLAYADRDTLADLREEARMDAAIERADAERKQWLSDNAHWLRDDFIEAHADLFAAYQQAQWDEYAGGDA